MKHRKTIKCYYMILLGYRYQWVELDGWINFPDKNILSTIKDRVDPVKIKSIIGDK